MTIGLRWPNNVSVGVENRRPSASDIWCCLSRCGKQTLKLVEQIVCGITSTSLERKRAGQVDLGYREWWRIHERKAIQMASTIVFYPGVNF